VPVDGAAGTLSSHSADVLRFAACLPEKPVLLAHSFGGLIAQQLVSTTAGASAFHALALLCSSPPTGNGGIARRMMRQTPLRALRTTYAFISRAFETDASLLRECFFSPSLLQSDLLRYQALICGSGSARLLDLRLLNASLPVPPPAVSLPCLVLGGELDAVVDAEANRETAAQMGTQAVMVEGVGHDVMLDSGWQRAAEVVLMWLEETAVAA
jgi:pimeloyl-ACP methyl ester carboxylesterase